MKITDRDGNEFASVSLHLTEMETKELIGSLLDLLTNDDEAWHAHVENHTHTVEVVVLPEDQRFAVRHQRKPWQ